MEQTVISNTSHRLYKAFAELYAVSFPIFEQRTAVQQEEAFGSVEYKLTGYEEGGALVGFIACWEFERYVYIEHFAVDTGLRGAGYGTRILQSFIRNTDKTVLLEIDPITDDVSAARLRFYKRCGFCENVYPHRHPAYRDGYRPHSLIVLTTNRQIAEDEYDAFRRDLYEVVMKLLFTQISNNIII